ncbi:MAG: hypothetical protein ACI9MB_003351 [Verrucomicrobiales bacterium]|jgi:hypothetical protein
MLYDGHYSDYRIDTPSGGSIWRSQKKELAHRNPPEAARQLKSTTHCIESYHRNAAGAVPTSTKRM